MKKLLLCITFIFIIFQNLFSGADGTLDTATFNPPNGFIVGPAGFGNGIAINTLGQIFLVGNLGLQFVLARYSTNGLLETSIIGALPSNFTRGIAIQADGKIIIAGGAGGGAPFASLVIRYNTDLTVDTVFQSIPGGLPSFVQIQADSKIVIAGASLPSQEIFVARFNPDGTTDNSFGLNGTAIGPNPFGTALDLIFQPDGKIIVAGSGLTGTIVARYNTDGTIDTSFGTGGFVLFNDLGGVASAVLMQPDQKIITVGFGSGAGTKVIRFNNNGTLDTTFNGTGIFTSNAGQANDGSLQADGKIIAYGENGNVYLERITTLGTLDVTFGPGGFVSVPAGRASAGAIQQDGKLVAGGINSLANNFLVSRYLNSVPLTPTTITFPTNNQTVNLKLSSLTITGTAQNPSNVYLFLNGNLIGGVPTDPAGSNTWEFTINDLAVGSYTLLAVALYKDGQVNISSGLITFTISSENPVPVLPTNASAIVSAIINKYCPLRF